ncbi:MAG: hypothetical protein Q4C72_06725 [Eubacteriales bacterium]|nr:hypothetical protein [Eubacteriales bacterium]
MNEQEKLEQYLEEELRETLPGDGMVESVNPWYTPLHYIVWGMILTSITLQFAYLQYLLPTVGIVLQYLGFRSLRRNGGAFRLAWALSLAELIWHGAALVSEATPFAPSGELLTGVALAGTAAHLVLLLALRRGLRDVFRKAELEPEGDPLRAAVIWQLIVVALALSPMAQSWVAMIIVLIAFVVIVRALFRVGDELAGAGYCFVSAPVKVSGGALGWGYVLACLALVLLCGAAANHPRLDAEVRAENGLAAERQTLADLGFPADILQDLSDEDVKALEGAKHVETEADTLVFTGSNTTETAALTNPDSHTLRVNSVYIELPGYRMAVLNYFAWLNGSAYWGDAFRLSWEDEPCELVGGALLYEKGGQAYAAAIPRLKAEAVTSDDWFFGERTIQGIAGTASYPFGAERPRGYVLYVLGLEADRGAGGTVMVYRHRNTPFALPYRTPSELTQGWTDQTLQQFYRNYETEHFRNREMEVQ